MSFELLEDEVIEVILKEEATKALILYNDDYNTFEHVINCLIKYCEHTELQAEQCAYLVHYTGKCVVKNGSFKKLKPIHEALLENGLTAKIED
ncbi:MAG: ATP-dependent Clp protease adaptor ClpS [Bacteroidota bacterium]|jgi:ATP-dependent Clp protease adaptor protein ClpS|nr:ATP-dependent Clp protease adaptor ClpS [Bacteroidota bacterium]MCA6443517.1 ATP-dependent Clp protease adaptor ClpS [Bacteroidota bacterium]